MPGRSPSPYHNERRTSQPERRERSDRSERESYKRERNSNYDRRGSDRFERNREPAEHRRDSERQDYDQRRERRDEAHRGNRRRDDRGHDRDQDRNSRRSRSPPRRRSSRSRSRSKSEAPEVDHTKPNFGASGLLAAETKTVKAADGTKTVLKYHEPPEARKPPMGWRLYVFKGSEQVDLLHLQKQSAYLVGRDRAVVDIFVEHPSCSKQHAALQFRHIREKDEFGEVKAAVKPFVIDLESTNGTKVNDQEIPAARYYELRVNDIIKFGDSLREYVLLHDEVS